MKSVLDYYKVNAETDKVFELDDDPSYDQVMEVFSKIIRDVDKGKKVSPQEHVAVIFLFAGHGILKDGCQAMVMNEYDPDTKFYKLLRIEDKIRSLSNSYTNVFNIAIFACCRELWKHEDMIDKCIANPKGSLLR